MVSLGICGKMGNMVSYALQFGGKILADDLNRHLALAESGNLRLAHKFIEDLFRLALDLISPSLHGEVDYARILIGLLFNCHFYAAFLRKN